MIHFHPGLSGPGSKESGNQGDVDAADTDKVRRQFRADAQTIKTRTNCSRKVREIEP